MSLKHELASEPLHISVKLFFSNLKILKSSSRKFSKSEAAKYISLISSQGWDISMISFQEYLNDLFDVGSGQIFPTPES